MALACGCTEVQAPGWAAIERALAALHGEAPVRYLTEEDGAIDALACFQLSGCFHLVTFGLSELYDKVFASPEVSGLGFELTMRVPRQPDEEAPPAWALQVLSNLAHYVKVTGRTFSDGERLDAGMPLGDGDKTAVSFSPDPELPPLQTRNGQLRFLLVTPC